MKTYTYGTTPIKVIEIQLPHKYKMELNKNDMMVLLAMLKYTAIAKGVEKKSQNWAMDMRLSILETIGIEEI